MQWGNWDQFYRLFQCFNVERIDEGKYPNTLIGAFHHPIFIFKEKKNARKRDTKTTSKKGSFF